MESFNNTLLDKKNPQDNEKINDIVNLICDSVRNYFSIPWFDLNEQHYNLIRDFIKKNDGKRQKTLLVDLFDGENVEYGQLEPKFELISLDELKRRRQQQDQEKHQSILFIKFTNADLHSDHQNHNSFSNQSTSVQIRLVTDNEAVKHLSEILKSCTISNEEITFAYKELERFIDRDEVLQNLFEERTMFLKKVGEWSESLLEYSNNDSSGQSSGDENDNEQYTINSPHQKTKQISKELNQMAEKILTLKQRQQLLANILSSITLLFRNVPDLNMYRMNLTEASQMLDSESNQLFHRWTTGVSKNIRYDLTKPCIIIDERTNKPQITFSPQLENFAKHARKLREFQFIIPNDIENMETHVSLYIDFVRDLRQIVRFYMTIAEQIILCQRPMLINKAKAFTSLLESQQQLTWMDGTKAINDWISELKQFMVQFKEENDRLRQLHLRILETIKWMIDASFSQWDRLIEKSRLIIEEAQIQNYQNTYTWRKHWDYQLYKILEYYFLQMIRVKQPFSNKMMQSKTSKSKSVKVQPKQLLQQRQMIMFEKELSQWERMNQITANNNVELKFNSFGLVEFEPSFEELKQNLFKRFQQFIKFPSTFHAFVDWSLDVEINPANSITGSMVTKTLFHNIYYRNASNFKAVYHKLFDAIEELVQIREQFTKWTAMYNLIKSIKSRGYDNISMESSSLNQQNKPFLIHTLDEYQHNLRLIKDLSTKFSNKYSMINEIQCKHSHILVNIIPIKMFVEWLFNEAETVLLQMFRDQCQKEINQIEKLCRSNIDLMKRKPSNINELIEFDHMNNEKLETIHSKLVIDKITLREKIHFLKNWCNVPLMNSDLITNFDETKSILNEFENTYENRIASLDNYRELFRSKSSIELENVNTEIDSFFKRWTELTDNMKQSPEVINDFQINCNQLIEKVNELTISCEYFKICTPSTFQTIHQVQQEIQELYGKFHVIYEFEQGLNLYQEMEWIICRNKLRKINQYVSDWIESHPPDNDYLKSYIERWQKFLTFIEICRGDSYQQLHWNQFINSILGFTNKNYEDLKLLDLWIKQDKLIENRAEILEINKRAFNDKLLREALNDLNHFALNGKFIFYPYQTKDNRQIYLIKDWHQCFNQISDCFLLIQTMKNMDSSEISEEYLNQYQEWETKLVKLESLVMLLNSVQRKWISLEPIYHLDDQANGYSVFNDVIFVKFSNDFQEIMKIVRQNDGRFSHLLNVNNWDNRLKIIDQNFSNAQKKLRTFIEESRQRFPRFYFLADEDLLLILSGKVDLNQSCLVKKLFVNTIGYLVYKSSNTSESNKIIEAIESIQGEVIRLHRPIPIDNTHGPTQIENWLQQLDMEIKLTLKNIFIENLSRKHSVYTDFELFAALPSQALSLFCYLDFTETVENSIKMNSLSDLKIKYERILSTLTIDGDLFYQNVLASLTKQRLRNNLSTSDLKNINAIEEHLSKIKIKQVVLDVIHFITIIKSLIKADVRDQNHWCWQSQLRFYVLSPTKQSTDVRICMGLATFDYSFEYLGCLGDSKLVYTTLTNKCFLTLTQAMDLGLGGNPYGPAGTGKTESVKALGQYFGRQVLVFNCDEAIDVKSMTRIIVGLLKCGNWGCFDEFNRLQLDVLSVLSSQIQEIQNAIKNKSKFVNLDEYGHVTINNNTAIFITLNPVGKNYGGRNRIPDNLKSLFLPVAMTIPENKTIVRFLSLAEGFSNSATKIIGDKISSWFEFAQGSMSQQRHYDWGLRTIKACLESSGKRLNTFREVNKGKNISCDLEIDLVIDTLRQQIKSKLIDMDALKFDGLVEAVFGKRQNEIKNIETNFITSNETLINLIEKVFTENNLIQNEYQTEKILQFYEQIQTRFGVVLIGPSGCGKTTIWQMLRRAWEQMSTKDGNKSSLIDVIVINPKSMPRSKLFGYIDEDTREWHDGLLSAKSREITRDDMTMGMGMHWIVFDGDIDPDWVEALNSVLDDNRVLTLPSGERIDFDWNRCRILFETTSLKNASPATISRLGVVSIDMIMINEMVQCYVAKNQLSFTIISIIQNYLNDNYHKLFLPISTVRSLLEHFNYCQTNQEDDSKAIERITGQLSDVYENDIRMINNLVVTESTRKHVEMLKPLVGKHICLTGSVGSGKSALAQELLFTTTNGHLISMDCTPTTEVSSFLKVLLGSTTIIHNGSDRILRSQSGQKLWIFIRHFELLTYDKWSSNSLISLLMLMLKHKGFYHPDTFEWITLDHEFQVVLTCTDIQLIDKRLLTLFHLVHLDQYTLDEIEQILQVKAKQIPLDVTKYFPSRYLDKIRHLDFQEQDNQNDHQKQNFNFLKIGIDILDSLRHYEQCDHQIVDYEIYRTLLNNLTTSQRKSLLTLFEESNPHQTIYTSLNGQMNYKQISLDQFRQQIIKWVQNYCQENDIQRPEWPLFAQTIVNLQILAADLCSFLACSANIKDGEGSTIPIMMIVGLNGSGRKFLTKTVAHNFGYDKVWSPDSIVSERHLNNELSSLFSCDETSSSLLSINESTNDSKQHSGKKLLLLIDEIHFDILPYLRDQIYTHVSNCNLSNTNLTIRLILTATEIKPLDRLIWLRKARIHHLMPFDDDDFQKLTIGLIKNKINEEKLPNFDEMIRLFYQIYIHFQDCLEYQYGRNNIRSYMDFIQTFIQLYLDKLQQLNSENERMKQGVTKLDQVSNQLKTLKDEAFKQKELLDSKRAEADEAFQLIMNSMNQSENKKVELEDVQQQIKVETDNLKERKAKIDQELGEIEPTLQAAKAAIGRIRADALSEIRSLRAPPEIIRDILEGVLRLMGVNDTSWVSMKMFLSRRGVKDEIMNFDCHKITPEMRVKVEQLLKKQSESFQSSNAKRASAAAAPLAEWVKANVEYSRVLHKIEPLEIELKKLESSLSRAQTRIKTLDTQLQDVDTEVGTLRERMQAVTVEAAQIEINLQKSTEVLERSESIVNDFSAEHQRWNEQLNQIKLERNRMPFKCMIAAAYVTQACKESSFSRRTETLEDCFRKFNIDPFDLIEFLQFENEEEMILFGPLSKQLNKSMETFQMMIPLIFDPTHKTLNYFNNVEITRFSAKECLKVLELSIRFGRTVIVTDFNQFDVRIIPLILGNIHGSVDTRFWTFIGEKKIDYNPKFSIYIMTDNLNNISPSTLSIIRVVNLSPSFGSISSQLLGHIIYVKRPELESEKMKLDLRVRDLQKQLKELENELLEKLSTESGNILENVPLIEKLKYLKKSAAQVQSSLEESDQLKLDLERERMLYKELSLFAANLYFSIENLPKLCPMYYFGYGEFERLFIRALKHRSGDLPFTEDDLCYAFYYYVSRALFSEHRRTLKQFLYKRYPNHSSLIRSNSKTEDTTSPTISEFFNEVFKNNKPDFGRQIFLIITISGSDPTTEIKTSMQSLGYDLQMISMGNDAIAQVTSMIQMSYARQSKTKLIDRQTQRILCLNNLHLVIGWLPKFIQLLNTIENDSLPLILITEPCENFPTALLEMCIKFAYESAPGLRSHLRRLRSRNSNEVSFRSSQANNDYINKLRVSLEYFHAICCERRFYIPFGWTKNYEFSFNEFHFGCNIIDKAFSLGQKLQKDSLKLYEYLDGLFHQVIYGGKVDFFVDENVLSLLLKRCFHPNSDFLFQSDQELKNGDFMILGLPLNANDFRERSLEKQLKQNLQLLSSPSSIASTNEATKDLEMDSKEKTLTLNPSGIVYFRKLWIRVLSKCKIDQIEDLKEEMASSSIEDSSFLNADNLDSFIEHFILFEFDFAKRLIVQIDHELHVSPTMGNLEEHLKINRTPDSWLDVWLNGTEVAQDFLINLARIYIKLSRPPTTTMDSSIPSFNMTYCFHPKLFLNSLKQFAAKKLSTSIDCLKIQHHWHENPIDSQQNETIPYHENQFIHIRLDGIWIEGALFQGNQLQTCSHNSPFTSLMPPVTITFSMSPENIYSKRSTSSSSYSFRSTSVEIALYSCSKRQVLLEYWLLPCPSQTIEQWLEMGVALVLGNFS